MTGYHVHVIYKPYLPDLQEVDRCYSDVRADFVVRQRLLAVLKRLPGMTQLSLRKETREEEIWYYQDGFQNPVAKVIKCR